MSTSPNPFADKPPTNPYTPPNVPGGMAPAPGSGFVPPPIGAAQYAPCPQCGNTFATKIAFTWWGGVVGPALFTHVKCCHCGSNYNGKTGRSNTLAITIYVIVGTVLVIGLMILLTAFGNF